VATVPASIAIPQGSTTKTFTITAKQVTSGSATTVTATRGTVSIHQILTVVPISLQSLDLTTYSVTGGTAVQAAIRIAVPAPSEDIG